MSEMGVQGLRFPQVVSASTYLLVRASHLPEDDSRLKDMQFSYEVTSTS